MSEGPPSRVSKPYFFLPVTAACARATPAGHERFRGWTGRFELIIEVQSEYLHAGSGLIELTPDNRAYGAFSRRGRQLILPATGLKGAIRAIVEAISQSCVSQHRQGDLAGNVPSACRGVQPRREGEASLCPACRIFGVTGFRGRVHFTDGLELADVRPEIVKIGALRTPRLAHGRKFYYAGSYQRLDDRRERNYHFLEAVPKGTRFSTVLNFDNATTAELGLIARALGWECHPQKPDAVIYVLTPKLGGAKPRCLGSVRFHPGRLVVMPDNPQDLLDALATGGKRQPAVPAIRTWLDDRTLLDPDAWEKFMKETNSHVGACLQEMY
jgi:CRISPR/Cas system CSM-associated protein Csm3 (group 7 of RAMP superfamily)